MYSGWERKVQNSNSSVQYIHIFQRHESEFFSVQTLMISLLADVLILIPVEITVCLRNLGHHYEATCEIEQDFLDIQYLLLGVADRKKRLNFKKNATSPSLIKLAKLHFKCL